MTERANGGQYGTAAGRPAANSPPLHHSIPLTHASEDSIHYHI
jgi:hypothetical protein